MAAIGRSRASGLIIFRRRNAIVEYLLLQHSYGSRHWTPPKGHVDPGENDYQAAVRETEEESGLAATDYQLVNNFKSEIEYMAHRKLKTVVYFLAEIINANATVRLSNEHNAFEWLPIEMAAARVGYDMTAKVLRDADRFLMESSAK